MNRILFLRRRSSFTVFAVLLSMCFVAFGGARAYAQSCQAVPIMILEMFEPNYPAYNLWDSVYGREGAYERFVSAVPLEERRLLVVGERRLKKDSVPSLFLAKLDERGRSIWEREHFVSGLERVEKIVRRPSGGYMVLATRLRSGAPRHPEVWIGVFSPEGALLEDHVLALGDAGLVAHDIVPSQNGSFLISTTVERDDEETFSRIYTVDERGRELMNRAFRFGAQNEILTLLPLPDGQLLAGGYMRGDDGQRHGWVFALDDEGRLLWEQQYLRGESSHFMKMASYDDQSVVVVGRAKPIESLNGFDGGIVMRINIQDEGAVMWERYYIGPRDYEAVDVLVDESGMMSVALNGINDLAHHMKVKKEQAKKAVAPESGEGGNQSNGLSMAEQKDFVRLLTIDPRGLLLLSHEHFNDQGVYAHELLVDEHRTRMVLGRTLVKEPSERETFSKGWVISVPPLDSYQDPCAPSRRARN